MKSWMATLAAWARLVASFGQLGVLVTELGFAALRWVPVVAGSADTLSDDLDASENAPPTAWRAHQQRDNLLEPQIGCRSSTPVPATFRTVSH